MDIINFDNEIMVAQMNKMVKQYDLNVFLFIIKRD